MAAFVVFCRKCLHKTDKETLYNHAMDLIDKSIPKEYLALRINYCKVQLKLLPNVKMYKYNSADSGKVRLVVEKHKYESSSRIGERYYKIWQRRDFLQRKLTLYEAIWHANFKGEPLPECEPHRVKKTLCVDATTRVVMNKEYFDSLKNDANIEHPKPSDYPFNGIYYRSAAEREIAMFYTEMGIPFKYEPEVTIKGLPKPIYPDFVIYIEELDTCKIHEHFGIKDSSRYLRVTAIKYSNYTEAGLVPELDILFTHDTADLPFDIRYLSSKLNTAVYGTMISTKQNMVHEPITG